MTFRTRISRRGLLWVGLAFLMATPARSQTFRWEGPAAESPGVFPATSFFDTANWQGGVVPSGESAVAALGWSPELAPTTAARIHFGDFQPQGGGDPILAGDASMRAMYINSGSYIFDFGPGGVPGGASGSLALTNYRGFTTDGVNGSFGTLAIGAGVVASTGQPGVATLEIVGQGFSTELVFLGSSLIDQEVGGRGHLKLAGSGTRLDVGITAPLDWGIVIADNSSSIEVTDGAALDISNSLELTDSTAFFDGAETSVRVGNSARVDLASTVTISGGASVEVLGNLIPGFTNSRGLTSIGDSSGLLVTGAGSSFSSAAQIQVGVLLSTFEPGNVATMTVADGASVTSSKFTSPTSTSGLIGRSAGETGIVTVTGNGSTWTQDGFLAVGFGGDGTLEVEDGGFVQSVGGGVARNAGSTGTATVRGLGSLWTVDDSLFVGGSSTARGGEGALFVEDGGLVLVGDTLKIWSSGEVDVRLGGSVTVGEPPNPTPVGTVHVGVGGTLAGTGTVLGNVWIDGGTLSPGDSPGIFTVDGDYLQSGDGLLVMEIAGPLPGTEFDQLMVTGDGELGGSLLVRLLGGFLPDAGAEFELIRIAGLASGRFATIGVEGLDPSRLFETRLEGGSFFLRFTAVPEPSTLSLVATVAVAALGARRFRGRLGFGKRDRDAITC